MQHCSGSSAQAAPDGCRADAGMSYHVGDYFDPMFVKPMVALRPLHYSAEVRAQYSSPLAVQHAPMSDPVATYTACSQQPHR